MPDAAGRSVRVAIYTGRECSLCRPARDAVARVVAELGPDAARIRVEVVEIDGDAALEAAYRLELPVVEVDGRKAAKYAVDEDVLERRLRRALADG